MSRKIKSLIFDDLQMAKDEQLFKSTNVWAFDFKYLWLTLLALLVLYLVPLGIYLKIPILIIILWYGTYSFRQSWRLALTDRRIIARRLYPRPLSYFLTKVHNFPYRHLEGLSTGPRNNIALFLVGLFLTANLGINILKSSLGTEGLELPDILEFVIFLMVLLPPFRNRGESLEADIQEWYQSFARDILQITGVSMLIIGIVLMLISFPWKQFLVLRIRYAKDFKLRTSISDDFIRDLYERYYEKKTVKPPKRFKKWHFPWFEGEEVEAIADMEQILFLNRIVGLFALVTGTIRLWYGINDLSNFSSLEFILWVVVAVMDIIVITLSIRFSTRDSDFVITNYRIIFAQEVKQLSGVTGRRYFFISDLNRDDIASFDFRKVTSFAMEYLIGGILVFYISAVLFLSNYSILAIIFALLSIFFFAFVYQTYVGFSLKTKSGDSWVMRHQLANPATRLRQFIGSENNVFSRMLSNRLEEKEIINAVQHLRTHQIQLEAMDFETEIEKNILSVEEEQMEEEFTSNKFISKRFTKKSRRKQRIQLSLEDILLKKEKVIWEKIIPYPLNWKFLTMFVGTVMFVLTLPAMFSVAVEFRINPSDFTLEFQEIDPLLTSLCILIAILVYGAFQLKYFTLRRKSLVITKKRLFYEELVRPPKWLFFLGIFKESYIREAMIDQLQIVGSGTYVLGGYNWNRFLEYLKDTIIRSVIFFILINLKLLILSYWKYLPGSSEILIVVDISLILVGVMITWAASNMMVYLIQSWPTLELHASGIGVEFRLPYLTQPEAEEAQFTLWSGVGPIEKLQERKRLKQLERDNQSKKESTRQVVNKSQEVD